MLLTERVVRIEIKNNAKIVRIEQIQSISQSSIRPDYVAQLVEHRSTVIRRSRVRNPAAAGRVFCLCAI